MIIVYYKNTVPCVIRPTPLVSISHTAIRNKIGTLGSKYSLTLTGTLIDDEGSPIYSTSGVVPSGGNFLAIGPNYVSSPTGGTSQRPPSQSVDFGVKLSSIFQKQQALRQLFALDGQKIEILPITADEPIIVCYPVVESINFEEGVYVNICRYTINLSVDTLLDKNNKVFLDSSIGSTFADSVTKYYDDALLTELDIVSKFGGFVDEFNDTWSVELEDNGGQTPKTVGAGNYNIPRSYRVTRNLSATGRTKYIPSGNDTIRLEGWEQAKGFIQKKIITSGNLSDYPGYVVNNMISKGFLNIPAGYQGFNHARTENIDKANGSYNLSDTWLVSSGDKAFENYTMSVQSSIDSSFVKVNVEGNIKGLSSLPASGYNTYSVYPRPYDNALQKYFEISNSGQFGVGCNIYKRASNSVAHVLNSQPMSLSLGMNEFTGEITYSLEFNNRPVNVISGVLGESITVNDTYPGDVFAVIPVIGRPTGPILQYIGGRTEYRRQVGIEFIMDYSDLGYGNTRSQLLLRKPSLNEPIRTQLSNLINELSPANEPGVRKYFLEPPSESWNPKDGRYTLNLNWIYELDR